MELCDYESAKFELAEILRAVAALAAPQESPCQHSIRELFAKLAEDHFNLVVVGRFNRGKTSLMNAILGMERLPTGILPLTSVITRVAYGSREKVELEFERGGLPLEIEMECLHDYVTQRGNPGNRMGIRQALVELPAEILRRGFYFVDTPGLGSAISENTRTTEQFLPEADAILMVSGCDSPLTDEELQLIRKLASDQRKLFLIVNKQDIVTPEGRLEVIQFMREQLAAVLSEAPPLLSVSARDGIIGKLHGDTALLDASGLPLLESALVEFLTRDKRSVFLSGMVARLRSLIDAVNSSALIEAKVLQGLNERIAAFGRSAGVESSVGTRPFVPDTSRRAGIPNTRIAECSVCNQVIRQWFEFLRHYQALLAASAEERRRFAQRGGFCERHMPLYEALASDRDLCLALSPLLERIAVNLAEASSLVRRADTSAVNTILMSPTCTLCEIQQATERAAFAEFTWNNQQSEVNLASTSVCLPHLRLMAKRALETPQGETLAVVSALMSRQAAAAARLAEDTQRYVLKRDALRYGLASKEEDQAARMAVALLMGHRKVMPRSGPL